MNPLTIKLIIVFATILVFSMTGLITWLVRRNYYAADFAAEQLRQEHRRMIYVDLIYNPNYYNELMIVRFMILDIISRNPQTVTQYDYDNLETSTIVTVGAEHGIDISGDRDLITIKTKLLKDILFNDDVFQQIYHLLLDYFRTNAKTNEVPEFDRFIRLELYRKRFAERLRIIEADNFNKVNCRNDELEVYENKVCIYYDEEYVRTNFKVPATIAYYLKFMPRIIFVVNEIIGKTFNLESRIETNPQDDCYNIELRPEIDVRKVLLFPHRASKDSRSDEVIESTVTAAVNDLILFKHRTFHALGANHKYVRPSVMTVYAKPWQKVALFGLLNEDYDSLGQCYNKRSEKFVIAYNNGSQQDDNLISLFLGNDSEFDRFKVEFATI